MSHSMDSIEQLLHFYNILIVTLDTTLMVFHNYWDSVLISGNVGITGAVTRALLIQIMEHKEKGIENKYAHVLVTEACVNKTK